MRLNSIKTEKTFKTIYGEVRVGDKIVPCAKWDKDHSVSPATIKYMEIKKIYPHVILCEVHKTYFKDFEYESQYNCCVNKVDFITSEDNINYKFYEEKRKKEDTIPS